MMKIFKLTWLVGLMGIVLGQEKPTQFSLNESIEYTLTHNYDMLMADNEILKAEKKIWETTASGLPQINANVDYTYNIQKGTMFLDPSAFDPNVPKGTPLTPIEIGQRQTLSANAQLSQLIFSGSYLVGLQSAKAFKQISLMSKEKATSELTKAVINAYAAVVIADQNIAILEQNLKTAEKNLHDITEIYKVGLGDEQSVDQMSYNLLSLKSGRDFALRQRQNALNTLKYIMGLKQSDDLVLTTEMDGIVEEDLLKLEEVGTPVDKIKNHIDYKIAAHQVKINDLQVKYQKTMALPTLTTFLQHSQNWSTDNDPVFDDLGNHFPATIWGVSLKIPIFSSLQRSAVTQQAQLDLANAEIEREKTEQRLVQEVKNNYLQYENALDRYYTNKERVKLTRKIFEKEQIKYFEGLSSSMDLSNTEVQMYQAENELISSAMDLISAKAAFHQSIGTY
ncbi:MAG: TolC family protein [Weeksellaceae bacterium]